MTRKMFKRTAAAILVALGMLLGTHANAQAEEARFMEGETVFIHKEMQGYAIFPQFLPPLETCMINLHSGDALMIEHITGNTLTLVSPQVQVEIKNVSPADVTEAPSNTKWTNYVQENCTAKRASEKAQRQATFVFAIIAAVAAVLAGGGYGYWGTIGGGFARARERAALAREAAARAREKAAEIAARMPFYHQRWPLERFPYDAEPDQAREILEYMLEKWPAPPQTEPQRLENEKAYWNMHVTRFSTEETSRTSLKPRQTIIDTFVDNNMWFLMEYYAATGIYHEPFEGPELMRLRGKLNEADQEERSFGTTRLGTVKYNQREKADAKERAAREKLEEYMTKGKKDFIEKRGGWFVAQIEFAFRDLHGGGANTAPSAAATPIHDAAQDDIGYRLPS